MLAVAFVIVLALAVPALAEGAAYSLSIVYQNPTDKSAVVEGVATSIYPVSELDSYAIAWPEGEASASEWDAAAKTLANYVVADGIEPLATAVSDAEGTSRFEGLDEGLYLVVSDVLVVEDEHGTVSYTYQAAIVAVPGAEGAAETVAYPKGEFERTDKPEPGRHKVTKRWLDEGNAQKRPKSIKIEIYCDGDLFAAQELSDANNWVYEWEDDGAPHTWTVVEREIAEGYAVTIDGMTITNTYPEEPETPPSTPTGPTPKTGQAWLPVPVFLIAGIVMLALGRICWVVARRSEQGKEAK